MPNKNYSKTARGLHSARVALMGGAYGNLPALRACVTDAIANQCDTLAFLGDAIGCCGHSDETLLFIRSYFDLIVSGNHEQQAAANADSCGCGYSSQEDERIGCQAFDLAIKSLSPENCQWLATWPKQLRLKTVAGDILLCHGSPDRTNEFLYWSELTTPRIEQWLTHHDIIGFACTHTGIPWIIPVERRGIAINCGAVGKPDNDGDAAVHYAVFNADPSGLIRAEIRRVAYDESSWIRTLRQERIPEIFVSPLETGHWTNGLPSLPPFERQRIGLPECYHSNAINT